MKSILVAFAVAFALLLAGCKYGEVAHVWPSLRVERIQFSESDPASFRALVEKPVLSGARSEQQKAMDEWTSEVISFGNCSNATVEAVLDTMSAKLAEDVAAAVAFLLGAERTSGCIVPVDGGQSLTAWHPST